MKQIMYFINPRYFKYAFFNFLLIIILLLYNVKLYAIMSYIAKTKLFLFLLLTYYRNYARNCVEFITRTYMYVFCKI